LQCIHSTISALHESLLLPDHMRSPRDAALPTLGRARHP
jgi:hypothetical protein